MGYRPKEQSLEKPITGLIDNIRALRQVTIVRMDSNDWKAEHIEELHNLCARLSVFEPQLVKLKMETW